VVQAVLSPIISTRDCLITNPGWGSCAQALVDDGLTVCTIATDGICGLGKLGKGAKDAANLAKAAKTATSAADRAAFDYATTSSKLDHIFAGKNNFDPLVQQYGSQEAVVQQFLNGIKGLTPESGTFEQQIVVGGQKVIVRGAVVDGVTKIGTAFTP
jgi:hypothetical protein